MTAPDLSGIEQIPGDRRGWLALRGLPDEQRRAEDATLHADMYGSRRVGTYPATGDPEQWASDRTRGGAKYATFTRAATDTERLLLQHLGYVLPDELTTHVAFLTRTLRCRTWPQLEEETNL
jgi:hypothetical protein